MKPCVFNLLLAVLLPCLPIRAAEDTPPPLGTSPTPASTASASPDASVKPAKAGKKSKIKDPNATPKPKKPPKEIPFVLPVGEPASHITIPENDQAGILLMKYIAEHMRRSSNELVEMDGTTIDLNHPDGSEDFHVILPKCVFNLKTRLVNSDDPVTIRTKDFELTGEKMEFNTVDRNGKLLGHVHMSIHNLKQIAGPPQAVPTPE